MEPVNFKYSNRVLGPPENISRKDDIVDLPVFTDKEQCVSCWRPSWCERLSVLFFGKVWLGVLSGGTQPPVYITATRNLLEEKTSQEGAKA